MLRMLPRLARVVVVVVGPLALGVFAGCDDGAVRAPVTIVVDTDGARAREDTQRLREVQRGVQGDRAQLEKARDDLAAARKSLETAASPGQKASLAAEVRALEARLEANVAVVDVVTKAELDLQLRALEERMKAFWGAEAKTTSTSTPPPRDVAPPKAQSAARADVADGRRHLAALHVEVADVGGALVALGQAEQALARGDEAAAAVPARAFVDLVNAVVVDRAFVRRKYERVSAALKGRPLTPEQRARAEELLRSATRLSATDAPGANSALNEVLFIAR